MEIEKRKAKRFGMNLPLEIVRQGSQAVLATGETRNMSSTGVAFVTGAELSIGERIDYVISWPGPVASERRVGLSCCGTVIRVEKDSAERTDVTAAATLQRYQFVWDR